MKVLSGGLVYTQIMTSVRASRARMEEPVWMVSMDIHVNVVMDIQDETVKEVSRPKSMCTISNNGNTVLHLEH